MKYEKFVESVNEILKDVDFDKLDSSCNGADKSYAAEILKRMHEAFLNIYGDGEPISDNEGMIDVPALIRGRETGHMAIGLVFLDLDSSCEHWGTDLFTPFGVLTHGSNQLDAREKAYLNDTFIPYDYWYTPTLSDDIHVNKNEMPEEVREMITAANLDVGHSATPEM